MILETIHLNHCYILLITCLLLSSKINLRICFIVLLIMIFYVLLGVFVFHFLRPYHAHKLDFCSSPYVFLGYSFSHLSYRYLDLVCQYIYVFCHVCFHKDVFSFANSEQIAQ